MKQIAFALLIQTSLFAQNMPNPIVNKVDNLYDPFFELMYDKVVVYNINYDSTQHQKKSDYISVGDNLEKFNYQSIPKSSFRTIDKLTINELIKIISDTSTYGQQYADCFEPRLGITFILNNKPVFSIFICFDCGFLEASIPLPASHHSYYDVESYEWDSENEKENKDKPIFVRRYLKGFSEEGEKKLLTICKQLKMNYCTD